jgi:hypothetical protein
VHEGATLGRRFTALRTEPHDIPGVVRWVAHDSRRDIEVTLDVLVGLAPGAVRQAAVRAAQVRDAHFARVLASGRENVGSERITYVVTERPSGVKVSDLTHERVVPVSTAAAIVGDVARALQVAAGQGIHHGHLRAQALTVTDSGRVVVSGLDADGELATQAGLGRGRTERADATSLALLFLALITGMDAEQVTVPDLPSGLTAGAANLARAAIAGTGPTTLAEVADGLGPADAAALRSLRSTAADMPPVEPEPVVVAPREPLAEPVAIAPETLHEATHQAELAHAADVAAPAVAAAVTAHTLSVSSLSAEPVRDGSHYATEQEAAAFSKRTRRAVERTRHEPLALDAFEEISQHQNEGPDRSIAQAMLEWVQRHVPQNAPLDALVERTQERAQRSGPINSGPLLVGLALTALIIVGLVSFSLLTAPPENAGELRDPEPSYPEFTYSPEPLPSPSGEDVNAE